MSNATRRSQVRRDGWKGENRRSTTIGSDPNFAKSPDPRIDIAAAKVESERELSTSTNVELFSYSAVMECSRAAYSKGWSRGFTLGICVGGAVALLTYAITFATSVLS